MAFGTKKKEGLYLRPRVRRVTPLMDIALAVIVGGVSGVYIFNDTFKRWQDTELMLEQEKGASAGQPVIPGGGLGQQQQQQATQQTGAASSDRA